MSVWLEAGCSEETTQLSPQSEDLFDLSETARANKIAYLTDCRDRTISGTGLKNAVVSTNCIYKPASLLNSY